jgi:penicillin-binding protein 1A
MKTGWKTIASRYRTLTVAGGRHIAPVVSWLGRRLVAASHTSRVAREAVARRLHAAWSRRAVRIASPIVVALTLWPPAALLHHVYLDRSDLPEIGPFILFTPPTTGQVLDARGEVLIRLAREYRQVVTYDEIPLVVRQAVMAAEDKNFFSHSGVDYGVLPRVVQKTLARSARDWWRGSGLRLRLPQGGSTITQQLVRVYFLDELMARRNDDLVFTRGLSLARALSVALGAPAANKLLRKVEEVRLAVWLEDAMGARFGTRELAKREIFARYASFIYLGNGRYGFSAASEYYFDEPLAGYTLEDAAQAASLAAIGKSPGVYAPAPGRAPPLRRRNQILALMARNGYISEELARRGQTQPLAVVQREGEKTGAPAVVAHVFDELRRHGGGRFAIEDLFQGRIQVRSTVDQRIQTIVDEALENGLARYEERHPRAVGVIQGSVVVLANADAGVLAEVGGRRQYELRGRRYSDFNRVTDSLRQPGSVMKPLVFLAAFRRGLTLDAMLPDEPISVPGSTATEVKWIGNYDREFKGTIPARQALAESRNAAAVWLAREIGMEDVLGTSRELGLRTPLRSTIATALGASEVRLLELAGAYRVMACGLPAEPHVIRRVEGSTGTVLYEAPEAAAELSWPGLAAIQEGLRGVIRLPGGTGHRLSGRGFPIPVMGKTGTTSDFRDALFVGSTYGARGITVAIRIGFDDNRTLGRGETGSRAALPVFREILERVYREELVGGVPQFPRDMEDRIDAYLAFLAKPEPAAPVADAAAVGDAPPCDGRLEDVPLVRPPEGYDAAALLETRNPARRPFPEERRCVPESPLAGVEQTRADEGAAPFRPLTSGAQAPASGACAGTRAFGAFGLVGLSAGGPAEGAACPTPER